MDLAQTPHIRGANGSRTPRSYSASMRAVLEEGAALWQVLTCTRGMLAKGERSPVFLHSDSSKRPPAADPLVRTLVCARAVLRATPGHAYV